MRFRIAFALPVVLALSSCGEEPCGDHKGACLLIEALSSTGALGATDAIRFDVSKAQGDETKPDLSRWLVLPSDRKSLPAQFVLPLPEGLDGSLVLKGVATLGMEAVGLARKDTQVAPASRLEVQLPFGPPECRAAKDCTDQVCSLGRCLAATCSDQVKNGTETATDCGGTCPACPVGMGCKVGADCQTGSCNQGVCTLAPLIQALLPARGPTTGGTEVRVRGGYFASGDKLAVRFGGVPAQQVMYVSPREVLVKSPARPGMPGKVDVVLENPDGEKATSMGAFRYYYGQLGFDMPKPAVTPSQPRVVVSGDFNQDKKVDLAVASSVGGVSVLLGKGDGTFQDKVDLQLGAGVTGLAVADLSGDGHLDLVAASNDTGEITAFLGKGDGTFGSGVKVAEVPSAWSVALFDLDGDSKLDLVATSRKWEGAVHTAKGKGDGSFQPAVASGMLREPVGLSIADLNGDTKADVAVSLSAGSVQVLLGKGDGTLLAPAMTMKRDLFTEAYGITHGDFNGDGKVDLVLSGAENRVDNGVAVLIGKGDGTFQQEAIYPCGALSGVPIQMDLDADGLFDLVVPSYGGRRLTVLISLGDGTFQEGPVVSLAEGPFEGVAADLNGDGKMDLALSHFAASKVNVLLNKSQ